jgi:hypothetical protein
MIKTLNETHRTAAEQLIRGHTKTEICKQLGIARSTLYDWMEDALFQEYFALLVDDFEKARRQRMLPLLERSGQALLTALGVAIEMLESADPATRGEAPSLKELSAVHQEIHGIVRLEQGKPTGIKEERSAKPNKETLARLEDMFGPDRPRPGDDAPARKH